jgi:hypothetical protein
MQYILVTEGGDDRMLASPINWLLEQHCTVPFSGDWANPGALEDNSRELEIRMSEVQRFYPADLYFVHRDTDTFDRPTRVAEIEAAIQASKLHQPCVCVVPVRMTEAWFLFSEEAIRNAADKSRGRVGLNLPRHAEVQRRADPKALLEEKLVLASELSGRRLAQFRGDIGRRKSLVAKGISDFSPLRQHDAFRLFETELVGVLRASGWG